MACVASRRARAWNHFVRRAGAAAFVPRIVREIVRATVLLLVIVFAGMQSANARGPYFSNLSLSPESGSVDAGATMPVSFDYDVVWDRAGDCGLAVKRVEVIDNGKPIETKGYEVHGCTNGDPDALDELREGPITVNLGVGTHVLMLRAYANKPASSGYSDQRTIIITSNDDAQRVAENVPSPMVAGQQYDVSVTLKNTGANTWAANSTYQLGAQPDDKTWGISRVMLDTAVAPGASKEFKFKVTAPAAAGNYPFQWRMLRGSTWFGEASTKVAVSVIPPKPTLSVKREPDPMYAGEEFKLTWTSTNATKVEYACTSNGGYVGSGTKDKVSDTETLVAEDAWVGHPSDCKWTATGPGGTSDPVPDTMTTIRVNYDAAFVDQRVPASVNAGHTYAASLTMKNTGTGTWRAGSSFQLGSQNPVDNQTWGLSRVDVDAPVSPGQQKTFNFSIKAPTTLGDTNFQWQMVRAGNTWFGTKSTNKVVKVLEEDALIPVAITPPHLTNPDAGTLPGELGVNNAGAATYSIPIEVPPGTAGLKPNLSISYSSQAGNGPLGLGWSLGGMSSIHRCGKTIAQDGVNGRIRFDIGDRLCLDGQRLVLVNKPLSDENYWSDKAEFRTEIDQMSRITAYGAGKLARFKVETRDHREIWYGGDASGPNTSGNVKAIVTTINPGSTLNEVLPYDKGGALSWAVDRITDRAGNYIAFTYEQDSTTGEHKPVTIRYGGVGLKSHAAVQFVWEARPDAWKRYVDDARNDLRSRISHIKTYYGDDLDGDVVAAGTLVRDYAFTYEQSQTSGRSMLTAAKVCAQNPQTAQVECLPATSFEWGKPSAEAGWVNRGAWPGAPSMTTSTVIRDHTYTAVHAEYFAFADFENHGYTDVLEKRVSSPSQVVNLPGDLEYQKDANELGFNKYRNQYRYFHNTGGGFDEYKYQLSTGQNFVVLATGDFNGDGAPDLLAHIEKGAAKICLSPLAKNGPQGAPGSMITFDCNNSLAAIGDNSQFGTPHVMDVLGDGRAGLYSRVDQNTREATLCIQDSCVQDTRPPVNYLGYTYDEHGSPPLPLSTHVRIEEMIDFAGTGKQQNARLTSPHYLKAWTDVDGTHYANRWENKQPIVYMTGFRQPGTADEAYGAGSMVPYLYNPYKPDVCKPNDCTGVLPPYAFDAAESGAADFNGTGYSGLAFGFLELAYEPPRYSRAELTLCLSTGRRMDCGVRKKYSGADYILPTAVGNYVGDGMPALRGTPHTLDANGIPQYGPPQMCRVLGDDTTGGAGTDDANIVCEAWSGLGLNTYSYEMDLLGTGRTQVMVYDKDSGEWIVFEPRDRASPGQALDRIYQVTNGLGAMSKVAYVDGVKEGLVTRSGNSTLSYPQHPTAGVGKIAKRVTHDIGSTAQRSFLYRYEDAGVDVAGRGSLGFAKVTQIDEQKYTTTTTTYSQQWPFVGMVLSQTFDSGYMKPRSETTNRYLQKTIVQSNKQKTYCPLSAGSTAVRYDNNDAYLGTVTTSGVDGDDIQYDRWCNLLKVKTVSKGSAVDADATFTTTKVNEYYDPDIEHWLVDLVEYAKVTKEQSGDDRKITRYRDVWYETNFSGRVSMEKLQNWGDQDLTLTIEYKRGGNPFGLVNSKIESWMDPVSRAGLDRTTKTTYDPNGRLPITLTNGEGHTESRDYNYGSGALTSHIDANKLQTIWTVNGFGRALSELRSDGNETRSYVKQCSSDWSDCPHYAAVARITDYFHGDDRMAVPQVVYEDFVGHVLQSTTWGFDGRQILVEHVYDGIGRLYETFHPRYKGDLSYLASYQLYDDLDRVWYVGTYGEDSSPQHLFTDYQGMVTVITNAKSQMRTEKRDVLGQVRLVIDNNKGETKFGYDAWGNLTQTIDPNGNVINVTFDDLGHKTKLDDPDLGVVTYTSDAVGRTRRQISPNDRALKKSTEMEYDKLDRMIRRSERSLESHWVYDTATNGVGQLAEAYTLDGNGKKDYRRIHAYDALGRPSTTTQVLTDGNYISTPEYDGWGRLNKQTHQRGTDQAKEFYQRYNEYGYQSSVERPGLVLSQVLTQDASNRVTLTRLGNGLTDSNTFNRYTGRMVAGMVKSAANEARLQESYTFDPLGNVLTRNQQWDTSGFDETFTYDELNRLETSTVDGKPQKTFDYDDAGNLTIKTGLGIYTYPAQGAGAVRPHAVQSIANIDGTFEYDDNGNLKKGAGRDLTWTSFDMPVRITKGAKWSQFAYGPEHQRAKQTRSDGMTIVYAGSQEVETKNGFVTVKTYWPGGIGFEKDELFGDSGTKLYWTHADRLGSPVAITDSDGNIAEKLEYDAWGKRRSVTDNNSTPDTLDGVVDNKGFTHHEMLDQLDLVHMNGRVYDPWTARFISGDPLVQDPINGQSYNRYAYVLNNPTNLTDPTGFASACTGSRLPGSCGGNNVKLAEGYPQRGDAPVAESSPVNGAMKGSDGSLKPDAKKAESLAVRDAGGGGSILDRPSDSYVRSCSVVQIGCGAARQEAADRFAWESERGGLQTSEPILELVGGAKIAKAIGGIVGAIFSRGAAPEVVGANSGTPQVLLNQQAGNAARDSIQALRPGSLIEQNFRVTGGLRRVDVLDGAIAIESKVGRTSLTAAVRQELARDVKMMRSGQVDSVEWHFSPSPTTGKVGPTEPLRIKLEKFGIPIVK